MEIIDHSYKVEKIEKEMAKDKSSTPKHMFSSLRISDLDSMLHPTKKCN